MSKHVPTYTVVAERRAVETAPFGEDFTIPGRATVYRKVWALGGIDRNRCRIGPCPIAPALSPPGKNVVMAGACITNGPACAVGADWDWIRATQAAGLVHVSTVVPVDRIPGLAMKGVLA